MVVWRARNNAISVRYRRVSERSFSNFHAHTGTFICFWQFLKQDKIVQVVVHQNGCAAGHDLDNSEPSTPPADDSPLALVPFGESPLPSTTSVEQHTYRGVRVASSALRRAAERSSVMMCRSVQAFDGGLFPACKQTQSFYCIRIGRQ